MTGTAGTLQEDLCKFGIAFPSFSSQSEMFHTKGAEKIKTRVF
jgi:hypothetical protein